MEGGSLSPAEFYGRFKGSLISPRLSPDRPAGSPLLGRPTIKRRSPLHRGINGTISLDVSLDRDERFYCLFPVRSFDILLFLFAADSFLASLITSTSRELDDHGVGYN